MKKLFLNVLSLFLAGCVGVSVSANDPIVPKDVDQSAQKVPTYTESVQSNSKPIVTDESKKSNPIDCGNVDYVYATDEDRKIWWCHYEQDTSWSFNERTKTLHISGNIPDYTDSNAPWSEKKDVIESIKVKDGVTSIGNRAFYGLPNLRNVTIPDSVTRIGDDAFAESGLFEVNIPNSVTSIGDRAFAHTPISKITIPNLVTSIGESTFENCYLLEDVVISSSLESIGDSAFKGCKSLKQIGIPNSVTKIGDFAFKDCKNLRIVYDSTGCIGSIIHIKNLLSDNVPRTSIGKSAFEGCEELIRVSFRNRVSGIRDSSLRDCKKLNELITSNFDSSVGRNWIWSLNEKTKVLTVSKANFGGNLGRSWELVKDDLVESVVIKDGVTSIYARAFFGGFKNLRKVTIPDSVVRIGDGAFAYCKSLKEVKIPDSVKSIGAWTFSHCESLEKVEIPDSVTSIGESAFYFCRRLKEVEIPDSVTSIGYGAFSYCDSLKEVKLPTSLKNKEDKVDENESKGILGFLGGVGSAVMKYVPTPKLKVVGAVAAAVVLAVAHQVNVAQGANRVNF